MSGEVSFSISEPRVLELGPELLAAGSGPEVFQGELRGVVELLAGRRLQGLNLLDETLLVEPSLHFQNRLLGGFKHRVEAPQHGHGEDDVTVLAADVDVAEDVVRDAPDVVGDPIQVWGGRGHEVAIRGWCPGRPVRSAAGNSIAHRAGNVTVAGTGPPVRSPWEPRYRDLLANDAIKESRVRGWRGALRVRCVVRCFRIGAQSGSHGSVSTPLLVICCGPDYVDDGPGRPVGHENSPHIRNIIF